MKPNQDEKAALLERAVRTFVVAPYDPQNHGAFVRSTWAQGALRDGSRLARERLDAYLREPHANAVLAHPRGNPDRFAGWAARVEDALVFAFVLPVMRGRMLASLMLGHLGFDAYTPVPLLHWTPSAQDIAAGGGRVYYAPRWHVAEAQRERFAS